MADFLHDKDETLMRYLDGEMDPTEKEMFESQLQKDITLKERLESLRVAIASVQHYGTIERVRSAHSEMMQELSSVHKETKVIPMRRMVKYSLAIAASIIIILVGVNLFTSSQLSSNKLYSEAFVDYDASVSRGNENQTEIERLYQDRSYTNVIEKGKLQNVSQKDSLLVGISFLKTNELADAINWLRSISIQNPAKQDAEFYLALSYLKNKNYNDALNLMQQIHSSPNHVYRNQFSEDYINKVKKLSSK